VHLVDSLIITQPTNALISAFVGCVIISEFTVTVYALVQSSFLFCKLTFPKLSSY